MAPSRYDWKIVDWDVKPQHNQPTTTSPVKMEFSENFLSRITVQCLETYFLLLWLTGNLAPNVMTSNQAVAPGANVISWIWAYDSFGMTYT